MTLVTAAGMLAVVVWVARDTIRVVRARQRIKD